MKDTVIQKIESAIQLLKDARKEIEGREVFYNGYYANITLYDHILQLERYVRNAHDTNVGLSSMDVLKRDILNNEQKD